MPEYLVRLVQVHESFRKAELEALAELAGVDIKFVHYLDDVSYSSLRGFLVDAIRGTTSIRGPSYTKLVGSVHIYTCFC